jgi:hypothetical protein
MAVNFIDLRTADESQIDQRARQPLDSYLEALAARVGRPGHDYQTIGDALWQQRIDVGQQLLGGRGCNAR